MNERANLIRGLPKADLHLHLDGAARPETLWQLSRERGVNSGIVDAAAFQRALAWRQGQGIEGCLRTFDLVTAVLQDAAALQRVSREVVEDAAGQGCTRLEVRYAPSLSTRGGLALHEVVEASLAGFAAARAATGLAAGLILCCWRAMTAREADEIAELAAAYAERGVVALDIVDVAGAAAIQDLSRFQAAYQRVAAAGLGRTCHAGEIGGPQSVRAAIELLGVDRIGHGVAATQDPTVVELVRARGITVEVCLTSNLCTGTVASLNEHPCRELLRSGIPVALCTDDPTMEGTTLCAEYELAASAFGLSDDDLRSLAATSIRAAF